MAVFNKFQNFVQDLGRGVHNLNSSTLKVMLSNSAPNATTHTVKADLTEISAGNGYSAGGATVTGTDLFAVGWHWKSDRHRSRHYRVRRHHRRVPLCGVV